MRTGELLDRKSSCARAQGLCVPRTASWRLRRTPKEGRAGSVMMFYSEAGSTFRAGAPTRPHGLRAAAQQLGGCAVWCAGCERARGGAFPASGSNAECDRKLENTGTPRNPSSCTLRADQHSAHQHTHHCAKSRQDIASSTVRVVQSDDAITRQTTWWSIDALCSRTQPPPRMRARRWCAPVRQLLCSLSQRKSRPLQVPRMHSPTGTTRLLGARAVSRAVPPAGSTAVAAPVSGEGGGVGASSVRASSVRTPLHVRIEDTWYDLSAWRAAHPGAPRLREGQPERVRERAGDRDVSPPCGMPSQRRSLAVSAHTQHLLTQALTPLLRLRLARAQRARIGSTCSVTVMRRR